MNFKKKFVGFLVLTSLLAVSSVSVACAQSLGTINGDNVNIRDEANLNSNVITKQNSGQAVNILGKQGDFYKIDIDGAKLYVASSFVDVLKADAVVTGSGVNIRKSASTNSDILGRVDLGDTVTAISNTGEWLKIEFKGGVGYIKSEFVEGQIINALPKEAAAKTEPKQEQAPEQTPVVQAPPTEAEAPAPIQETPVQAPAPVEEQVQPAAEQPQPPAEEYVPVATAPKAYAEDSLYAVISSDTSLRLRSEASTGSKVLTLVPSGEAVDVISQENQWVLVSYSGMQGYLSADYVNLGVGQKPVNTQSIGVQMIQYGKQFLGTPYVWAGNDLSTGVDCSGFVYAVYNHFGVKINRSSSSMLSDGVAVDKNSLAVGDLVLFDTSGTNNGSISHVGIYMGDGNFIHSSSSKRTWGVTISSLSEDYYIRAYVCARRVL